MFSFTRLILMWECDSNGIHGKFHDVNNVFPSTHHLVASFSAGLHLLLVGLDGLELGVCQNAGCTPL